jgi:DUF4097 and DUF4098 domain-containing protein YvlB
MALQKPEAEKYYYELKQYAQKYEKELDTDNLTDLYINLENYCIRKSRVGKIEFDFKPNTHLFHHINKRNMLILKKGEKMKYFNLIIISVMLTFWGTKKLIADDARLLFEKTLQTEPGKELITSLIAGGVEVTTWSNNEVNVKVYGNDEAEEKVIVIAENSETGVKVEGKKKETGNFKNLTLRVEIMVPESYDVKLFSSGGSLEVTNLRGKIEANTSGGSIKIENTEGSIEAYTAGGNISIEKSHGSITASTSGGKILIYSFNGNVEASTAGGDIVLTGKEGKIDASTAGGNIRLDYSGTNMGIDLSTLGGNITATLPSDFNADADIGTLAGKVRCDFAPVETKNKIYSYVKAKFNGGGEAFKCTTSAGNITVTKK